LKLCDKFSAEYARQALSLAAMEKEIATWTVFGAATS
jgi:hypothetical protein